MTLTELRYIIAVAKYKHFGNAAKSCHVSQPTLSVAIAKLEKELRITIFERHHNTINITDIGQRIVEQAQRVVEEVEKLKHLSSTAESQLTEPLRVGAIYTISPYLYPKLIPEVMKQAPQLPLIVEEDFTHNLRDKLIKGELDAIFIALPFSAQGVVTRPLYEEPFMVFMRKDHPLSHKKAITHEDLNDEDVLLLGENHCFRDQVLQHCPQCQTSQKLQNTIEGTSIETLRHMVASGMGITILPSSATQIEHYKDIACVRPFSGSVPQRQVALAWRSSFPRPRAIEVIIQAIRQSALSGVQLASD